MGIALSTRAIGKNAHEPTWPFKELPSIPAADLNSKSLELCHHRDRFGATIPKFHRMPDAYLGYYNERRRREKLGWLSPMQHHRSLGPAESDATPREPGAICLQWNTSDNTLEGP